MKTWMRHVAAAVSGVVLVAVSPPIGVSWLHWFSYVPVLLALHQGDAPKDRRRNFIIGWSLGVLAVGSLFFWLGETILTFSNIPWFLAYAILALFSVVFGLPYGILFMFPALLRKRFGDAWVFLFPCVWVTMELAQPALFPYYQGVGQYQTPWTWQLASVFGAMGLSWLVIATNTVIANLWMERGSARSARSFAIVAALFLANLGFGAWRTAEVEAAVTAADTPHLRVSMLQQGVTMIARLQDRGDVVLQSWIDLTRKVVAEHPDLVVWPEGSIYGNPSTGKLSALLSRVAQEGEFHLLLGGGTSEADPLDVQKRLYWNSCYLFGPSGGVKGRYDKMVPLPFGEYLPWPVSYLRDYIEGVGNFRAGTKLQTFSVEGVGSGPVTFSTPICYEAILESQMRKMDDVDLYVNITNDGWFSGAGPWQHAMLAAVHATEFGRPMVRVAYTGVSMTVDPAGFIRDVVPPGKEGASVAEIPLVKFETPYRTWGRSFPWLAAAIGAWAGWQAWRRSRPVTSPPPVT